MAKASAPLKRLLAFRLLLVSLLLGALILFEFIWGNESAPSPLSLYSFVIITYFLTIACALRLKKSDRFERFISQQLVVDATLIAGLIYLTGGFYSLFFPLFYLIILGGTLYLERQKTIALLFYCTFLYLLILFAHFYNPFQDLLPLPPLLSSNRKIVSQIFFNLTPFYLTAFILSFIAKERLDSKKRLQKITSDLKEFKDLNEHIIASIDSGLITTDQHFLINSINQAACNILNLDREQLIGRQLNNIIIALPPAQENHNRQRHEIIYQRPEGRQLILGFSFTPLVKSQNRHSGWIFIFQDLTELKEIEEHLQAANKMAAIGRLSAGIAHEIRNPLAAISGSIEILAKDLPTQDKTHQRLLQIILKESTRLNNLITDFLGFSRLDGKAQINTDIIALLKDLVFLFRAQCPETRFYEKYHTDQLLIKANPEQLEQIFWNIFQNALEAVDGCGTINISSQNIKNGFLSELPLTREAAADSKVEHHPNWIKIKICDNGPGISDATAKKIFEPFFTTKPAGTGLGLYIAFQLTRINNGSIQLSKREDNQTGTCAQISFPVIQSAS
ncbi:MAG: PAS domain S-box protein [Deltaproteobacteria bacterium]|nr:PAS domain S-box protein [Deltaproteobacteria bacterium]